MRSLLLAALLLSVPVHAQETLPTESIDQVGRALARPSSASSATSFRAEDGTVIPIQREWTTEEAAAAYEGVPLEKQPFRYDQRTPRHVHTVKRPGRQPIYYFRDVRWKQENRPRGASTGRRAFFTTVRVDPEKLKAGYFCMKPFAPKYLAGHGAVELEFEKGGFTTLDGQESEGFVLSFEAYLRVSQSYSMIAGFVSKKYRIIYVGSTWRDFLMRSIELNGSVVKRWKLKLSRDELNALARAIGRTIVEDHSKERYNTTRNSCITAALELIDQAVPERRRSTRSWVWGLVQNPGWSVPVLADNALRIKGLLDGEKVTFDKVPEE